MTGVSKKYRYWIGIDPGVNTGFSVWDRQTRKLLRVETRYIHEAMYELTQYKVSTLNDIFVRVEDARLRTWYGNSGREKLQGAGSVKRDSTIWDDFLKALGVAYEMVHPGRNITSTKQEQFNRLTGWTGKSSEHARAAAMLVFGI